MARRATNVTRTRIQAVARARFARCGYDATSLQQIATDLDVTKAALYYHFPAKARLLHSLADPFLDAERALLAGYSDGPLDAATRRELVRALIDLLLAHRPVVAWLTRDLAALAKRLGVQRAGATRSALMHWAEQEEEREREKRGTAEQDQ